MSVKLCCGTSRCMDFSRIERARGLGRFMEFMHLCVCGKRKKRSSCFFSVSPPVHPDWPPVAFSSTDFRQAGRNGLVPSVQVLVLVLWCGREYRQFDPQSYLRMGDILGDRFWRSSKKGRTRIWSSVCCWMSVNNGGW